MVVVAGAELFTGNNLIVMAWASGKVKTRSLLLNWLLTFTGNCVGAMATAGLMLYTTQYTFGAGRWAWRRCDGQRQGGARLRARVGVRHHVQCAGVPRVVDVLQRAHDRRPGRHHHSPIAAFVAAGFEHSIANAYFIPMGLFIKAAAPDSFWNSIGKTAADFPALTWKSFLGNLVPVAIGNIIGGSLLVAAVYWFVYLRKSGPAATSGAGAVKHELHRNSDGTMLTNRIFAIVVPG